MMITFRRDNIQITEVPENEKERKKMEERISSISK